MNKLDTRSANLNRLRRLRRLLLQYIIIFVFWRILEANNEEQINTRAYTKNISSNCLFHHLTSSYITWPILAKIRLCMKVGRGLRDTCAWGLGTQGRETRDLRISSMGRGDLWDGDAGTSNTVTQRTRDVNNYCKSRRYYYAISVTFLVNMSWWRQRLI